MKTIALFVALLFASFSLVRAQPADEAVRNEAVHNDLRALRDGLLDAMNKGDIDRQLSYLHSNVVVTWHNAEVSRGRDSVRKYYNQMTSGPDKLVESFHAEVNVDELTSLYGDNTGIAFGSSLEQFKLVRRSGFELRGRWTATLIKENGRWLVASLHVSTNLFDNAVLNLTRKAIYWVGGGSLVVGLIVGFFVVRPRKAATPPAPAAEI
jgi:ketosteroid isomerase-like protein